MIVCSDFDNTITTIDVCDHIIQRVYGKRIFNDFNRRNKLGLCNSNEFYRFFTNIDIQTINLLIEDIEIDSYFERTYNRCCRNNIDIYIVSSGFKQIISKIVPFVPIDHIYANDLDNINYDYNKGDVMKQLISNNAHQQQPILYIGDGISDIDAIKYSNIIYAKRNEFLDQYCTINKIDHYIFDSFSEIYDDIFLKHTHYKLLSPGVVRLHPDALHELGYQHIFMHRHDQFHKLYSGIDRKIKAILNISPDNNAYSTLICSGSGTCAMDEMVSAYVGNVRTLIISNGMFGERWQTIGDYYNSANLYKLQLDWGMPFSIDVIVNKIIKDKIDAIVMVHCDTSVGILNKIDTICKNVKIANPNITTIIDAVSTFGSVPLSITDKDYIVFNPNKGIAAHMGCSIIVGRNSKILELDSARCGGYSMNLRRHYNYAKKYETCNTISISSLNALYYVLENHITRDTIATNYNTCQKLFNLMYDGIKYPKLLTKELSSPCIITILMPDSSRCIEYLYNHFYIVYECKGDLLNKGFQVSLFGYDAIEANIRHLISLINNF